MRVGFDIDDVLCGWSVSAHAACEAAGITNGKVITQWSFHLDYGVTEDVLWNVLYRAYGNGMLLEALPTPGASEVLAELRDAGHTIHLVTARGFEHGPMASLVRSWTATWLQEREIPHDTLTFARDKTIIRTSVFLDDSIRNVRALRTAGVDAYLMDQPHNQSDTELPRVNSLRAFADEITHPFAELRYKLLAS